MQKWQTELYSTPLWLCLTPKSAVKVLLLITAMITLVLTEMRLNVLSTFMSKGLYDSMQDLKCFGILDVCGDERGRCADTGV
ncbi:ABC transporter%2C permease protein%2C SbmA/BacA family [Neisseria meningitidis]|uniref:Putative membrane protein n=1 Tax=Neisseria meningitidis alpha275 TaxID=295996 RepID=C6SKG8_NEIME|nr:hypothetical protein [Neisseria meningitidis]CBA08179.1 putative membrane protein [Neisseria meningitidis alpha275]RPD03472.1 hypothetical protein JY77_09410 [Neisseria meningitidis]CWN06486.1 ABC transporter%2C permease protein%2C SbmA/BacA family [Neisseria meningitidis]CWO62079.1 ABC transporter%2C permease protein%2C SbmA/BacA family [Neisseria meningitidis]CWO74061.1 ABC transporter%2C permease protein%2C SbmA/BacA family [Neisseria meningitidis]